MRATNLVLAFVVIQIYRQISHDTQTSQATFLLYPSPRVSGDLDTTQQQDGSRLPPSLASLVGEEARKMKQNTDYSTENNAPAPGIWSADKRLFVMELFKMLHEQYGKTTGKGETETEKGGPTEEVPANKKEDKRSFSSRQAIMTQLLGAISADGDMLRLIDWVQNSFNLASVGELTTQFVVSKLGSINCAAVLKPDSEDTLVPRFLLFNEHFADVPFELPINPSATSCIAHGRFDPLRKTVILLHGYLSGYTLVDGLTNIKNRILDINKFVTERAMYAYSEATTQQNNGSYLLADDIEYKVRQQQYNVILVDWFNGANPVPRSRYIRAAVNAQVVGKLIARFLSALVVQCRTPAHQIQIIAHSLGCHVAGFTGKAMNAAGHRLGKITHLDPIGLCFGRLFSEPRYRLSPSDAIDTQAVHVSLNLFDNPLDGALSNILVNGGRDQIGCGGQSELKNSTASSVSTLFDNDSKFTPCSHMRALSLYEDDLSSEPGQCQIVGYKCATYERFLAGKCGKCDALNNQCRLMSLPPVMGALFGRYKSVQHDDNAIAIAAAATSTKNRVPRLREIQADHLRYLYRHNGTTQNGGDTVTGEESGPLVSLVNHISNGSIAWVIEDKELNEQIGNTIAKLKPELLTQHQQQEHHRQEQQHQLEELQGQRLDQFDAAFRNEQLLLTGGGESFLEPDYDGTPPMLTGINSGVYNEQDDMMHPARLGGPTQHFIQKRSDDSSDDASQHYDVYPLPKAIQNGNNGDETNKGQQRLRSNRRLSSDQRERLAQTLEKIRNDARNALAEGWTSLKSVGEGSKFKLAPSLVSNLQLDTKPVVRLRDVEMQSEAQANNLEPPAPPVPLGGQALPAGSYNGPLYFVGTGPISPYCVNYYQVRVLITESRINRLLQGKGLASNHLAHNSAEIERGQQRQASLSKDMLHLTMRLTDSSGHFFKGFTLLEDARSLVRGLSPNHQVELTMLLNTTKAEPTRISESIVSYYFHGIVLADSIEINYMSNISPEVRAKYSSVLCPAAINDQHQLVRYIECNKVSEGKRRK